jgi:hypothetical protein
VPFIIDPATGDITIRRRLEASEWLPFYTMTVD